MSMINIDNTQIGSILSICLKMDHNNEGKYGSGQTGGRADGWTDRRTGGWADG